MMRSVESDTRIYSKRFLITDYDPPDSPWCFGGKVFTLAGCILYKFLFSFWIHHTITVVEWIHSFIEYPCHISFSVMYSGFLAVWEFSVYWSCIQDELTVFRCIFSKFVKFSSWWTQSHSYLSHYHIMIERRLVYSLFGHFIIIDFFNKFSFENRRKVAQ